MYNEGVKSTARMSERVRRLAAHPPVSSKMAAALAFGVDPTLTLYNMFFKTTSERLAELSATIAPNVFSDVRAVKRANR